ncbi:MAG: hypothetical protein JWP44_3471 [Mucilaginibacter sp.]|nr:hypothetical protein [Mucilaginibacter sp.]
MVCNQLPDLYVVWIQTGNGNNCVVENRENAEAEVADFSVGSLRLQMIFIQSFDIDCKQKSQSILKRFGFLYNIILLCGNYGRR